MLATGAGMTVPRLGLGTWQLEGDRCQEIVEAALELGYRHIDTAQMYGNEDAVGRAIAASGVPRDELFVTTKVWNDRHEPDDLVRSVDESLGRLGLDAVDLTLIHWPVDFDRMGATLAALANVHAGGATRHVGVSNFTVDQLDAVEDHAPLECLQVECHPFLAQTELRRWCNERRWAFVAYSPIAQGAVFDDPAFSDIAEHVGVEPATLAIAWLLHLDGTCAIPRTSDTEHLADNWSARSVRLDDETVDRITALDRSERQVSPSFAPWS